MRRCVVDLAYRKTNNGTGRGQTLAILLDWLVDCTNGNRRPRGDGCNVLSHLNFFEAVLGTDTCMILVFSRK